jgi:hypothetical protein
MATRTVTRTHTRTITRCDHADAVQDLLEGDGAPFFLSWCRSCGASKRGCYDEPARGEGIRGVKWEHDWRLPALTQPAPAHTEDKGEGRAD